MDKYINALAKRILKISDHQIAKVRFAKIIYFIHKDLITNNLATTNDLAYIRMPLGPVAEGFLDLTNDQEITVVVDSVGLAYNREKYGLSSIAKIFPNNLDTQISKSLKLINQYSTSQLINMSHSDPSWVSHSNGQRYNICIDDLQNNLLVAKPSTSINHEIDDQLIQSQLLGGMIDDVVQDSTALEHPTRQE